jgi:4-amino-4-deoxy-L-arabinose transferase-like glycosyltransferase
MSYRVLGVNEFATRLPTVLAMLLLTLLGVRWAGRAFGGHSAIYAGFFIATAAGPFLFTRIMIPEALLSLLIAASLYYFFTALTGRGPAWRWYAGYALLGIGVLAKGLVALVFVGATAFLYLLVSGECGGSSACLRAFSFCLRLPHPGTSWPVFVTRASSGFTSSTSTFCVFWENATRRTTTSYPHRCTGVCISYGCFPGVSFCYCRCGGYGAT